MESEMPRTERELLELEVKVRRTRIANAREVIVAYEAQIGRDLAKLQAANALIMRIDALTKETSNG